MIRKAQRAEIELLLTITKACAKKMIQEGIFQWNDHYPNKKAFLQDLKRGELYVLLYDSEVIGCITISAIKDAEYEEVTWLSKDSKHLYVHRLAVHPNYQHQGYAKKLMDFAETFGKENDYHSIRLDTFSQNHRNQRFYEVRGYTKLGNIYFPKQSIHPFYCYEKMLSH